jgi:hypothetical protein
MRNDIAARFVRYLHSELQEIAEQTRSIGDVAEFRRLRDHGELVTRLELSDTQRIATEENRERVAGWGAAVVSYLRRRGLPDDDNVEQLAREMAEFVLLRWTDRGNVREQLWRTKWRRELSRLSSELARYLPRVEANGPDAMRPAPVPLEPFPLQIKFAGGWQWRVCTAEGASELVDVPQCLALPPSPDGLVAFGRTLFDLLVSGAVAENFKDHRERAAAAARGVRIQLDMRDSGILGAVPWELLHDGEQFLCLGTRTSLVRYVGTPRPPRPFALQGPIRLLVMVSAAPGVAHLDGDRERAALEAALAPLSKLGLIDIDVVPGSSFNALRHRMRAAMDEGRPHHVWHFIGHGGADEANRDGDLVMTDGDGRRRDVGGAELEALFREHPALQMVVLNACDGVRFRVDGRIDGVASAFLRSGGPAVVAMQSSISDAAAGLFSEELYGTLSDGVSIDVAIGEARRAIFFQPNRLEWFLPVLLLAGTECLRFE